jgi:hypothetical protein
MSDYHIKPYRCEPEQIDYRGNIRENWQVDRHGMVTTEYAVECCFRHGSKAFLDVLQIQQPYVVVCTYPDSVSLPELECDDDS